MAALTVSDLTRYNGDVHEDVSTAWPPAGSRSPPPSFAGLTSPDCAPSRARPLRDHNTH